MGRFGIVVAVVFSACTTVSQQPVADSIASSAERVVQRQLDAYNRHDVDAFAATYASDVQLFDHPDRLRYSGIELLRENYGKYFASAPNLHATITRRIVQGNFVIDHEHVTGRPDGKVLDAVAIYEVRDERIQRVWFIR